MVAEIVGEVYIPSDHTDELMLLAPNLDGTSVEVIIPELPTEEQATITSELETGPIYAPTGVALLDEHQNYTTPAQRADIMKRLLRHARRRIRPGNFAYPHPEDIVSETVLGCMRHDEEWAKTHPDGLRFPSYGKLISWLYVIQSHKVADAYKLRGRRPEAPTDNMDAFDGGVEQRYSRLEAVMIQGVVTELAERGLLRGYNLPMLEQQIKERVSAKELAGALNKTEVAVRIAGHHRRVRTAATALHLLQQFGVELDADVLAKADALVTGSEASNVSHLPVLTETEKEEQRAQDLALGVWTQASSVELYLQIARTLRRPPTTADLIYFLPGMPEPHPSIQKLLAPFGGPKEPISRHFMTRLQRAALAATKQPDWASYLDGLSA